MMVLTRSFKDFIKSQVETDAAFRQALLQEAVQTLNEGDIDTAKAVLRDYINATIGFPALARATGKPPRTLMRLFGRMGNPPARHLLSVIAALQTASDRFDFVLPPEEIGEPIARGDSGPH